MSGPPIAVSASLTSVVAIASNDVWAAGSKDSSDGSRKVALTEHWDGKAWTIVPSPPSTGSSSLSGLFATGPTDVTAVGTTFSNGHNHPLVIHWNGGSWSIRSAPGTDAGFAAVSGTGRNDVWAVGSSSSGVFSEHWDGVAWSVTPVPTPGIYANGLAGVAALAPDDVWAVGESEGLDASTYWTYWHWDGTAWSVLPGTSDPIAGRAVLAVGAEDVWTLAVRAVGTSSQQIRHWDGDGWASVDPVPPRRPGLSPFVLGGTKVGSAIWAVGGTRYPGTFAERICPAAVTGAGFSTPRADGRIPTTTVAWTIPATDVHAHSVVDGTGLGLFDSGLRDPGGSFLYAFPAAGSYRVVDGVTGNGMTVRMRPTARPGSGDTSTDFVIDWMNGASPEGCVNDVQIQRPGDVSFHNFVLGDRSGGIDFFPDAGPGTYRFRSRLRQASSTTRTGWSPAISISVH